MYMALMVCVYVHAFPLLPIALLVSPTYSAIVVINKQLVLFLIPIVIPYRAMQILDQYQINEDIKFKEAIQVIDKAAGE